MGDHSVNELGNGKSSDQSYHDYVDRWAGCCVCYSGDPNKDDKMSIFDSLLEGIVTGLEPGLEPEEKVSARKKKKVKQLFTPEQVRESVRKWNKSRPKHMRVRIKGEEE